MGKISQQKIQKQGSITSSSKSSATTKVKRTRKSVPRDSPPQRSSIYRGVTRHRWTGRYEAHLWDKNCWNESQNKKGRQVYLGAYDDEEAAAHAYDLAALKYWGHDTILNFPLSTYQEEVQEMECQSKEEYIGSLRRVSCFGFRGPVPEKSSGFSRGVSKYRGVARHHHNGRWEARIGRVFGNKYLYLGTYATQEEAATAYDMAAIEYRGLNAVTNFDLSRYIKWLRPNQNSTTTNPSDPQPNPNPSIDFKPLINPSDEGGLSFLHHKQQSCGSGTTKPTLLPPRPASGAAAASSALGFLLQSPKFEELLDTKSIVDSPSPPPESDHPRSSFPDDIQTYFDCQDSSSYAEDDDIIFGDLNSFASPMFQCELDV